MADPRSDAPVDIVAAENLRQGPFAGITQNVVVVGLVSLFTDISSEMIYPILPLFLMNVLFALGNSSDAFLILRAQDLGLATALVPLAYFGFNLVYAVLAIPLGSLSDRVGRRRVIAAGYLIFAAVYLGFALAGQAWQAWPLFAAMAALLFWIAAKANTSALHPEAPDIPRKMASA